MMLSIKDIDFVERPKEKIFVDCWKFKVSIPACDEDIFMKAIAHPKYLDQSTITTTYTPGQLDVSFEVTDHGHAEFLRAFIARQKVWRCLVINNPKSYMKENINNNCGFWRAEAITKKDIKMPKVKTQAPTYYPSFMKFIKVIRSGPVTVAWIKSNKKVMIRKTKKDKDDLEKAMLMLFAKSQFDSDAAFHRWFRDQMKLFEEANNNAKN